MRRISYHLFPALFFLFLIPLGSLYSFIKFTFMVPMRDSVRLATTVYLPTTFPPPYPTLFNRTPYDERDLDSIFAYLLCDFKGYALVIQNLRGYHGSEGEPMVFLTDGWGDLRDGYDAIEWLLSQGWCSGIIGMYGASAHGMTQYLAAGTRPRVRCFAPIVAGPSMYHYVAYNGGVFRKALVETWLSGVGTPWLIDSVANHPNYSPFWEVVDLTTRWDSAPYPMFHITGWFDLYTDGQLLAFSELQARFRNQKLFCGPWGHGGAWGSRRQGELTFPPNAEMSEEEQIMEVVRWYDYWLRGDSTGIMEEPKVRFYLMGDVTTPDTSLWNRWVLADTWPLPQVVEKRYYLQPGGILDTTLPSPSPPDSFFYDPRNPCPTIGGREYIGIPGGYGPRDQRPIEARSDVLVWTTSPFPSPVMVCGKLRLILFGASNRLDTDWVVRVSDVYPDGRSILLTDNILMARKRHGLDREDLLTPYEVDTFEIDLWSTAYVFNTGHRLRVSITSSNYPRFERNPNTGAPFRRNDTLNTLVATNFIYHDPERPSHLLVPDASSYLPILSWTPNIRQIPIQIVSPARYLAFSFYLPKEEKVSLYLFDQTGRKVREIYKGFLSSGEHQFKENAKLSAGVYFLNLNIGEKNLMKKLVIIN